ncbi:MAG: hypothetical protein A49_00330 [Methyloceanibacter sp.]|nr:MAG: hypothetical protein A49_00330 [Methyloceanibacter sp.]
MRGFGPFCIKVLLMVFTLLVVTVPARAGDVAQNDKHSAAMHNANAGLTAAAQAVAAQIAPEETADRVLAETPGSGVSAAALEVAAMGNAPVSVDAASARELRCLAEGIYFEARGEPWRGQLAVGRVILNRVASRHYPDTICGVVYQNSHLHNRCQFSFACDGKPDTIGNTAVWSRVRGYAAWLLANEPNDETSGSEYRVLASLASATHYHADYVRPHWAKFFELTARIGRHIFYADPSA